MKETEGLLGLLIESIPVSAGCLQEGEGADNIRLDEFRRAMNRAVDMRLGGKVYDRPWLMLGKEFGHQLRITDITFNEKVAWIPPQRSKVLEIAGVGKFVEIDDGFLLKRQPVEHEVGADEAGTASDENCTIHLV